jgi:hypothetical protein
MPNRRTGRQPQSKGDRIIMTVVYLIAAALVVCACLFFIMRARSRD